MNKINKIRTSAIAIALLCACGAGKVYAQPTLQTPTMMDNTWYSSSNPIIGLNTAGMALGSLTAPGFACALVYNNGTSHPSLRVMDPIYTGSDNASITGVNGTPDVAMGNWDGAVTDCSTCTSVQNDFITAVAYLNTSGYIEVDFYDVYDDGAGTVTIRNSGSPIGTTTTSSTYQAQTVHIDIVAERAGLGSTPYCNEFVVTWDDYSSSTPHVYAEAGSLSSLAFTSSSLATVSTNGYSPDVAAIQYEILVPPAIDYYGLITYIVPSTNIELHLDTWDFSGGTSTSISTSTPDFGTTSNIISNPRIDAFDDYTLNNITSTRSVYKIVAQVDSYNTGSTKVIRSYDNTQLGWPVSSYVNVSSTAGIAGVSVYTAVPVWQYNNYAPTVAALQQTFPVAHEMEYDPSTPGSDIVFVEPVVSPSYNNFLLNDYYFVNSLTTSSGGLTIAPQAMNAYGTYASAICTPANYEVYGNNTLVTWVQQSGTGYDIKYKESTVPYAFRPAPSSVGAVQAGKWRMYPNPATDDLVVAAENSQTATVYNIADMAGRTLLQGTLLQQTASIAVSTLPPGTYLLRLDGNGSTWQSLFVKK